MLLWVGVHNSLDTDFIVGNGCCAAMASLFSTVSAALLEICWDTMLSISAEKISLLTARSIMPIRSMAAASFLSLFFRASSSSIVYGNLFMASEIATLAYSQRIYSTPAPAWGLPFNLSPKCGFFSPLSIHDVFSLFSAILLSVKTGLFNLLRLARTIWANSELIARYIFSLYSVYYYLKHIIMKVRIP